MSVCYAGSCLSYILHTIPSSQASRPTLVRFLAAGSSSGVLRSSVRRRQVRLDGMVASPVILRTMRNLGFREKTCCRTWCRIYLVLCITDTKSEPSLIADTKVLPALTIAMERAPEPGS